MINHPNRSKTFAAEVRRKIEAAAKTKEYRDAPARKALEMLHELAFAAAARYERDRVGYGWGPANIYYYPDGSTLTDDGRGYTCA